jgi:virulence factor Mce-like protein
MVKQAPTLGRMLVMVSFALSCFGLILFLWLAFGGPVPLQSKGFRFHASFAEATQLAKEADVRISGVSVGKVKSITPDKSNGRADTVIQLDPKYAPIPKDSHAILRQKTLLGETYVELTPGHRSAGLVKENGTLAQSQISPTVELDEIFRAFDPKTRAAFQNWMQQLAIGTTGRGRDINEALGALAPLSENADQLLEVLNSQSSAVRRLVRNTGDVSLALSERDHQLSSLVKSSNTVFTTTAQRNKELTQTFTALPTFEREGKATVERLTTFSQKTNPLVTQLRPAAKEFSPTFVDLQRLSPDLKSLFHDLDPLITRSATGLPATTKFLDELHPLLRQFDPALRQLNPILGFIGRYKDELNSFFANTVAATEATTIPPGGSVHDKVHYLRTTNPINLENLALYGKRPGTNRTNPYPFPGAYRNLKDGLLVYDDRQCDSAVPILGPVAGLAGLLGGFGQQLLDTLSGIKGSAVTGAIAPKCKLQGKFTVNGKTTQFPQVTASSGTIARGAHSK